VGQTKKLKKYFCDVITVNGSTVCRIK